MNEGRLAAESEVDGGNATENRGKTPTMLPERATDDEIAAIAARPIDDIARDLYYRSHSEPFTGAIDHIERVLAAVRTG